MHGTISILFLATAVTLGSPPQDAPRPAPERAKASTPELPSKLRAERDIEARAGSIDPQDERLECMVRIERFVLEASAEEPEAAPPEPSVAKIVGNVEWRRLAHPDGFQVECEILFARGSRDLPCQRVLHIEELCDSTARLVWREMGAGSGRSLLAEWSPGGVALRTVEWDRNETLREEIGAQDGAVMPLYLIEMLRQGRVTTGRYPVFDPLSRSLTDVEVFTSYAEDSTASSLDGTAPESVRSWRSWRSRRSRLRTVELFRTDGTLWGRYRFRGADLVAFQWQEHGPWARRASAAEYESARTEILDGGPKAP
jgi:hypothetical protein